MNKEDIGKFNKCGYVAWNNGYGLYFTKCPVCGRRTKMIPCKKCRKTTISRNKKEVYNVKFKIGDTVVLSENGKKHAFTSKEKQERRLYGKITGYSRTKGCYRVKWNGMQNIETVSENWLDPIIIPTKDLAEKQKELEKRIGKFSEQVYKPLKQFLEDCEQLGKVLDQPEIYYKASGLKFTLITNLRELIEMLFSRKISRKI